MSKKILIVGHGSGITTARINGHLAEVRERGIEIIEVQENCTSLNGVFPEPIDFEFSRIHDIPMPFIPKLKHQQKNHQRPYKFHK